MLVIALFVCLVMMIETQCDIEDQTKSYTFHQQRQSYLDSCS